MRIRAIAMGRLAALVTLVCLWSASGAQAAILTTPAGLNPGDTFQFLFVTSNTPQGKIDGTSTNVADYDAVAALEGAAFTYDVALIWSALVSTNDRDAIDVLPAGSQAIYTTSNVLIATSGTNLWIGGVVAPILLGGDGGGSVWTGTNQFGYAATNPMGFFEGSGTGNTTQSAYGWISSGSAGNHNELRLYAVSQILTVPFSTPGVPEPASLAMLAMAGVGVLGGRSLRRRKLE